jgi:hypothetical protein
MNNIQRWNVTLFMPCGLRNYNSPGTGNANLSKLDKEGTGAVKDDKLRKVLQESNVNAVILQNRTTQGGATSGDYGYWILYAKGRDTNLKEEKISKEDYEWLINFADRVDED